MINVDQALQLIAEQSIVVTSEMVPLNLALGRILATPINADRDFPPYHRITMDGIAIRFQDFLLGKRQFSIQGVQAAGDAPLTLNKEHACLEVMTGAVLPKMADTVIRYEDVEIKDNTATILVDQLKEGQNIHGQGSDRKQGTEIIPPGTKIRAAEIAILASVGKTTVEVKTLPRIAVISTGDELVQVSLQPLPHQIRRSNSHMLEAALNENGYTATLHHLNDDKQEILVALQQLLEENEVIILSGGVSKGKFDYLPDALAELGVGKVFHKVKQRPGKPFWFGNSTKHNTIIFALPGNPVSTFICAHHYVIPWLNNQSGQQQGIDLKYKLSENVHFKPDLTYFVPVKLGLSGEEIVAYPFKGNGSGDFANLVHADGFVKLPKGEMVYNKDQFYNYYKF